MSDVLNPTFGQKDDEFLEYGDEELSEEALTGEKSESAEDQSAQEKTTEELLFAIIGEDGKEQQVPFGKLTPQLVKEWFDSHQNKHDWSKSNTEAAQKLADEKRVFETKKQQFESVHADAQRWIDFFKANQGLQEWVAAFVQGRVPQAVIAQILGQQTGQQPGQATNHPVLNQVVQRLSVMERQLQQEREGRLQDKQFSEREKAMQAVLPHIPEEKREAFKQYIEQTTANMTDLQAMYQVLADAFQWGNRDEIIKQAQKQALEAYQKQQSAGVETGEQQSAVNLPENIDVSDTRDIGRIFDAFADQLES